MGEDFSQKKPHSEAGSVQVSGGTNKLTVITNSFASAWRKVTKHAVLMC